MQPVFLISKEFISEDELIQNVYSSTRNAGLDAVEDNKKYNILVHINSFREHIEVKLNDEKEFNQTLQNGNFVTSYGCLGLILFQSKENVLVPFLKAFLQLQPNIFLYDELIGGTPESPLICGIEAFGSEEISNSYNFLASANGKSPNDLA